MEYEWEWYTPGPDHLPIPLPTRYRQHQGPGGIPDAQHDPVFKLRTLYHPMYRLPSQFLKSSLPALYTLSLTAAPRGSFPALLPSLCLCHLCCWRPPSSPQFSHCLAQLTAMSQRRHECPQEELRGLSTSLPKDFLQTAFFTLLVIA